MSSELNKSESMEVQSPCIGVCVIDETSQLCQGCFRTLGEVQDWRNSDNAKKQIIIEAATERATSLFG